MTVVGNAHSKGENAEMIDEELLVRQSFLQKRKPSMLIHSLYDHHMKAAGGGYADKKQPAAMNLPRPIGATNS